MESKYRVAGLFARMENFYAVAQRHRDFGCADDVFLQKHSGGRAVYEYRLKRGSKVSLVPEPENPHDPNAIAVYVDDVHIGYIPAVDCTEVHQLLSGEHTVSAYVAGGARKWVQDGRVMTDSSELDVIVCVEHPAPQHTGATKSTAKRKTEKKPFYKTWWFWLIVILAIIGLFQRLLG